MKRGAAAGTPSRSTLRAHQSVPRFVSASICAIRRCDPDFSAASAWEIAVKHGLGKLPLPQGLAPGAFVPEARRRHGIEALAVGEPDAFELARLPALHNDPFDRMLICQAIANQMAILTPDPLISQYPVGIRW